MQGRKVYSNNYSKCSIDDYVSDASLTWTKDIGRPMFDIWYIVVSHAANLGEALRREEYAEAGHEVGRVAVWLVSFVARLQALDKEGFDRIFHISTPLSKIIWNKYPNCCPACYGELVVRPRIKGHGASNWEGKLRPCDCLLRHEEMETRNVRYKERDKEEIRRQVREYAGHWMPSNPEAFSFDSLEQMFFHVFQPAITLSSPETIGFHFLEEVGEVCQALTTFYTYRTKAQATPETYKARKLALENEIADVFSWLFAVSNKLRLIYEKFDRSPQRLYPRSRSRRKSIAPDMCVSKRIWEEYGKSAVFACRVCGQTVCNCPIYLATTNERIEPILNP